jgi:hypothetical protein
LSSRVCRGEWRRKHGLPGCPAAKANGPVPDTDFQKRTKIFLNFMLFRAKTVKKCMAPFLAFCHHQLTKGRFFNSVINDLT